MKQISITLTETAHWHALIGKAEFLAHRLLPLGIENYLIRLFMRFECEGSRTYAIKQELPAKQSSAKDKLQHLGDQCLLLCGFYPEAVEEYEVPREEFIAMGTEAYRKLASIEHGESEMIYEYLGVNFEQVVSLLSHICNMSNRPIKPHSYETSVGNEEHVTALNCIDSVPFISPISQRVLN